MKMLPLISIYSWCDVFEIETSTLNVNLIHPRFDA